MRWTLIILALLVGLAGGAGCSESTPPDESAPSKLDPVHWPEVAGASSYRVQAWHGHRLLFEVTRTDTVVVLTPSLARALRPFDEVEIQVRATDAAGTPLGGVHEARWEP